MEAISERSAEPRRREREKEKRVFASIRFLFASHDLFRCSPRDCHCVCITRALARVIRAFGPQGYVPWPFASPRRPDSYVCTCPCGCASVCGTRDCVDGEGDGGDGEGRVCGCITLIAGRGLSGEHRVTKAGGRVEGGKVAAACAAVTGRTKTEPDPVNRRGGRKGNKGPLLRLSK